jgi:hypothetical protein
MSAHVFGFHGIFTPALASSVLLKTTAESLLPQLIAYSVPLKRPMSWTFLGNFDQNGAELAVATYLLRSAR